VKNDNAFPRAFLTGQYRLFDNIDTLAWTVFDQNDNLRQMAYLLEEPQGVIDSMLSPSDTAYITHYGIDSVEIHAECETCKILTLSDNHYKDWHVFIDGEEAEPLVTYGTFRGVVLPPGEHTVIWKYIPSTYYTGKMVTTGAMVYTLLTLIVVYVYGRFRRRR
jgi:hypothetical protein